MLREFSIHQPLEAYGGYKHFSGKQIKKLGLQGFFDQVARRTCLYTTGANIFSLDQLAQICAEQMSTDGFNHRMMENNFTRGLSEVSLVSKLSSLVQIAKHEKLEVSFHVLYEAQISSPGDIIYSTPDLCQLMPYNGFFQSCNTT